MENEIDMKQLRDFFNCSICLSTIKKAQMTTCGHSFCQKCIKQNLKYNQNCPNCNAPTESVLIKNHQFDSMIQLLFPNREGISFSKELNLL